MFSLFSLPCSLFPVPCRTEGGRAKGKSGKRSSVLLSKKKRPPKFTSQIQRVHLIFVKKKVSVVSV
ncbi:MAG: hypothetical protein F6K56_37615 [Moorea sp. SIO3G5]|nr:hypothetical protein [Moorena sp. SIO3G5]